MDIINDKYAKKVYKCLEVKIIKCNFAAAEVVSLPFCIMYNN
ncbi:hypothetical protein HMPREF9969_0735 [Prevotella sp. oral taxon 306 str. F0472]|nr:hypothetical protein HMPREF9969_0735 [Prevotella sp. oral taxon 306 str. F0472]